MLGGRIVKYRQGQTRHKQDELGKSKVGVNQINRNGSNVRNILQEVNCLAIDKYTGVGKQSQ